MDTIQNDMVELYVPYSKAIRPHTYKAEEDSETSKAGHHYSAIAISEGVWNGATFPATTLGEMVDAHNNDGSATRIRMCAEHEDTITSLLGRVTTLRMEDVEDVGSAAMIEFDLFDGTQMQQDIITQLEQAPDLIGLSICATGNLAPLRGEGGEHTGWEWQKLRLAHVALLTWPGCDTTAGSITAAYKHADGTEFNPAIFTHPPTEYAMADPTISQAPTTPESIGTVSPTASYGSAMHGTNSQAGDPQPIAKDETKYAAALDLAQVISLSKALGIEANPALLASLTAEQAKDYAAELAKIAEVRQTPAATPEEKGSEYGAPTDDTLTLAKQLLNYGGNAA